MQTTMIDGVKVIKLAETHPEEISSQGDAMTIFHIWNLLSGGDSLRDLTVGNRVLR
ncbi:MAG: hypothetical protein JKX69_00940 [Rhodobacteraceae bacterium]|nr:hypothetical protein [Paracoccaceae bacterium]